MLVINIKNIFFKVFSILSSEKFGFIKYTTIKLKPSDIGIENRKNELTILNGAEIFKSKSER